jgi:hypothetical protein
MISRPSGSASHELDAPDTRPREQRHTVSQLDPRKAPRARLGSGRCGRRPNLAIPRSTVAVRRHDSRLLSTWQGLVSLDHSSRPVSDWILGMLRRALV